VAKKPGVSTSGMEELKREMREQYQNIPVFEAQFGIHDTRTNYKYKRPPSAGPKPAQWDNIQILVNGLMNQRRNPIFTTPSEEKRIMALWMKFGNQYLKRRSHNILRRAAKRVAEEMIKNYQKHMVDGMTSPGRPAKLSKAKIAASKIMRAKNANVNYKQGNKLTIARMKGYGVDTGQLYENMYISTKKRAKVKK